MKFKYRLVEQEEESGLKAVRGSYELILKALGNLTSDDLMDTLRDPENLKGTYVIKSKGLDEFLKTVFGNPLAKDETNVSLYKENGNELYRKIAKEVGPFKKGTPFTKPGLFWFPEKNAANLSLVKKYYEKTLSGEGEKLARTSLKPTKIDNVTLKFPVGDESELKKILGNTELKAGEDYILTKQKSEEI